MYAQQDKARNCRLLITYQDGVNESCILGVVGSRNAKCTVKSKNSTAGMVRLVLETGSVGIQMDVIRYLSCMDGVQQVLLTQGGSGEEAT